MVFDKIIQYTHNNYKVVFAKTGNISVPTVGMAMETQQLQLFRLPWIDKPYN